MKIQCPKCNSEVPSEQVNMATDLAFCPQCNEGFKISESIEDVVDAAVLRDPPHGAWFQRNMDGVVIGASTRSPIAFFMVPFMLIWSGGSLGGIYGTQIVKGEFDLTSSLFGIPFLLGSILFWVVALMAVCGKLEITIGRDSKVFLGIGPLGWTRRFDWSGVNAIREDFAMTGNNGKLQAGIVMEGRTRIKFGTGLNEKRRYFVLNALKHLKAERKGLY